jgi:hypothetical protein
LRLICGDSRAYARRSMVHVVAHCLRSYNTFIMSSLPESQVSLATNCH